MRKRRGCWVLKQGNVEFHGLMLLLLFSLLFGIQRCLLDGFVVGRAHFGENCSGVLKQLHRLGAFTRHGQQSGFQLTDECANGGKRGLL